jgi:hypothetical protein
MAAANFQNFWSSALAGDLIYDNKTLTVDAVDENGRPVIGPDGKHAQVPAPMGLTTASTDPVTGKLEVGSTVYLRVIEDFSKKTDLKFKLMKEHADEHEKEHAKRMREGLLPDNYVIKNVHEADAEIATLHKENNPTLSAYLALELWAKYLTPQSRTPTDWLSFMFKSAARKALGPEAAADFIGKYRTLSEAAEKAGTPLTRVYLDLLAKYGPDAEAKLAGNYANELENAGRLISQLPTPQTA